MPETRLSELLREKERINREIDDIRKAQREERERKAKGRRRGRPERLRLRPSIGPPGQGPQQKWHRKG